MITTQKEIRELFRHEYPGLDYRKQKDGDYKTDTRLAFIDFADYLFQSQQISEKMRNKVTL